MSDSPRTPRGSPSRADRCPCWCRPAPCRTWTWDQYLSRPRQTWVIDDGLVSAEHMNSLKRSLKPGPKQITLWPVSMPSGSSKELVLPATTFPRPLYHVTHATHGMGFPPQDSHASHIFWPSYVLINTGPADPPWPMPTAVSTAAKSSTFRLTNM